MFTSTLNFYKNKFVAITVAIMFVGFLLFGSQLASAQVSNTSFSDSTNAELQAMIDSFMAQIAILQSRLDSYKVTLPVIIDCSKIPSTTGPESIAWMEKCDADVPSDKPTPRFNGITYPVGTGKTTISAVFAVPIAKYAVTGPVAIGKISWGDNAEKIYPVSALVTSSSKQITVNLSHTYKKSGTYIITLTGLDGKMVSKKVTVTLPVIIDCSKIPSTTGPESIAWMEKCDADVPSDKPTDQDSTVLGASTNIWDEIGNTLSNISSILSSMGMLKN